MANVGEYRQNRLREAQDQRNRIEMRRLKEQHEDKYEQTSKKLEKEQKVLVKDYEVKFDQEKVKLEQKLAKIRKSHSQRFFEEKSRLDGELENLRRANSDQKLEIINAHNLEISELDENHQSLLDEKRRKFKEQEAKFKT